VVVEFVQISEFARGFAHRAGQQPRGGRRIGFAAMADRDPDCIFCKIVAGELPGTIVAEDERTVAFMDINPATRGHALVVPRRHTPDLGAIDPDDLAAVAAAAQRLATRARERLGADGINLMNSWGADAWQTVFHFHLHVIPRYADDPLQLPWKPESGDEAEIASAADALREG
jgi:histidine triad (HIT) family protein